MESSMSLHPTMAAALAPYAPKDSEVHKIAEQAMPGVEVSDATQADFVDTLAGDLELAPPFQTEAEKKLERAGLGKPTARAEARMSDQAYWALRNEVNS